MFGNKKKTEPKVPQQYNPPPMPQVAQPKKIKEFEDYKDLIIVPRHDTLDDWKTSDYLPYKDEILVGYNDIRVVYKLGDGIHKWNELPEATLEELIAFGYTYNMRYRYRIKLEFIPTRTMRKGSFNKCKEQTL